LRSSWPTINEAIGAALVRFGAAAGDDFLERLQNLHGLDAEHKAALRRALIDPLTSGSPKRIATFCEQRSI
jgi:hypothetical protein